MKHELFKTVCMKKWMIVLLAMIIVLPLSSDLYAASKKKKNRHGNPAAPQESKSLREVVKGEERGDFKK